MNFKHTVILVIVFGILHAHNTAADFHSGQVSFNGLECVTPCGDEGLYEDRYWCHTYDSWDFCSPVFQVERSATSTFQNGGYTRKVGKNRFSLSKIIGVVENALSRRSRPIQNIFSLITERQGNPVLANALNGVGLGVLVAGGLAVVTLLLGLLNPPRNNAPAPAPAPVAMPAVLPPAPIAPIAPPPPIALPAFVIGPTPPLPGGRRKRQTQAEEAEAQVLLQAQFCTALVQSLVVDNACSVLVHARAVPGFTPFFFDFVIVFQASSLANEATALAALKLAHDNIAQFTSGTIRDCSNNQCNSCPGGQPFNADNQCDAFTCNPTDTATSCNNQGTCEPLVADHDANDACVCNPAFGGIDCILAVEASFQPCPGQFLKGDICCDNDDQINSGGICCDAGLVAGGTPAICCAAGLVNSGGICCAEGQFNENGVCRESCTAPAYVANAAGACACGGGFVNYDGLCCPEGQFNENGVCRESCTAPAYVANAAGACACGGGFVNYDGLCCPEGQFNENGVCQESCTAPAYVANAAGACECGGGFANYDGLCCPEGQFNEDGFCVEGCTPPRVATNGICDAP